MIELLIVVLGVSASLTLLLTNPLSFTPRVNEGEVVLINYLNYTDNLYGESNAYLIAAQCSNDSFFMKDSYFFNESKRVIESLNSNQTFILLINCSSDYRVFNNVSSVCLRKASLAKHYLNNIELIYGSWRVGEEC